MEAITAAGTVRRLAAAAVTAASVDVIAKASRAQLERAQVDARGAILAQQRAAIQAAFYRCTDLAFETTSGGVLLGLAGDGRLKFPVPWSSRSYLRYGLARSTADVLRVLVIDWGSGWWTKRSGHGTPPAPVFVTDGSGAWYVNSAYGSKVAVTVALSDWPTFDAVAWLMNDLSAKASASRAQRRRGRKRSG